MEELQNLALFQAYFWLHWQVLYFANLAPDRTIVLCVKSSSLFWPYNDTLIWPFPEKQAAEIELFYLWEENVTVGIFWSLLEPLEPFRSLLGVFFRGFQSLLEPF